MKTQKYQIYGYVETPETIEEIKDILDSECIESGFYSIDDESSGCFQVEIPSDEGDPDITVNRNEAFDIVNNISIDGYDLFDKMKDQLLSLLENMERGDEAIAEAQKEEEGLFLEATEGLSDEDREAARNNFKTGGEMWKQCGENPEHALRKIENARRRHENTNYDSIDKKDMTEEQISAIRSACTV